MLLGCPRHRLYKKTVITSHENRHCAVTTAAFGQVLDQLRERIRYLRGTCEQAYVHWVRAFIRFHGVRHPATLGSSEVEAFLSWLANERKVSVSTHRQALAALLFFYGKGAVHGSALASEIGRPRPSRRLPVVLTPDEVVRILGFLEGEHRLFANFNCMERACGSVRVCNCGSRIWISITARSSVPGGKGSGSGLDVTRETAPSLREQLSRTGMVAEGPGRGPQRRCASRRRRAKVSARRAFLTVVLGFAQHTHSTDPRSGVVRRHHMYDQTFQRAFKRAVEQAGITKPATAHPPPLVRDGLAPQRLRRFERAGSALGRPTSLYDDLHACAESWRCRVRSPLDALPPHW